MSSEFDFCFASVYGRGHWLASHLAGKGNKVRLLDLTPLMGRWAPEDWEGPFGLFQSEHLLDQQLERLNEQDYQESVDHGFCLWLKSGPIDLKGPISSYLLKKAGLAEVTERVMQNQKNLTAKDMSEYLESNSYDESWLAYLSYYLFANHYESNTSTLLKGMKPAPIFTSHFLRRVSRRGFEQSLQWCEEKGVEVIRCEEIIDFDSEGKQLLGLEIKAQPPGVRKAKQFIWQLTGEETHRVNSELANWLFGKEIIQSEWTWLRYRFESNQSLETLPNKLLVVNDPYLPWTHDNLYFVQKTSGGTNNLDTFIRIPVEHRFKKYYIEEFAQKLAEDLKSRVPESEFKVIDWPQDYRYDEVELGPPPWPCYRREDIKNFRHNIISNVKFDSPEFWNPQDWSGQLRVQLKLAKELVASKNGETKKGMSEARL